MKRDIINKFSYQIIVWILAYNFISFMKYFDMNEVLALYNLPIQEENMYLYSAMMSTFAGLLQGILLAIIDITLPIHLQKNRSFISYVLHKSASYFLVIILIMFIAVFLRQIFTNSFTASIVITIKFITTKLIIVYMIFALIISFFMSFLNQIYKNIGPHVFFSMIIGRYYNPVIENRIFMFIDLKSSTTYAEKLGHILYSKLIQDCFIDLNTSVEKYSAQIDQYIGDEAVLTWKIKDPDYNLKAIYLFFDFEQRLLNRAGHYNETYGLLPEFKAGINSGEVTATEIGITKRSIAYHGDVLNTAARIQGECNKFEKQLLISELFLQDIVLTEKLEKEYIGTITLKGKLSETNIYSIHQK